MKNKHEIILTFLNFLTFLCIVYVIWLCHVFLNTRNEISPQSQTYQMKNVPKTNNTTSEVGSSYTFSSNLTVDSTQFDFDTTVLAGDISLHSVVFTHDHKVHFNIDKGKIIVDMKTGNVEIDEGISLNETSSTIWNGLKKCADSLRLTEFSDPPKSIVSNDDPKPISKDEFTIITNDQNLFKWPVTPANILVFGYGTDKEIIIDTLTGEITFPKDAKISDVSREIWEGMEKYILKRKVKNE